MTHLMIEDNEEIDSLYCDHGIAWTYECDICNREWQEFMLELMNILGEGNLQKGRSEILRILDKKI